jgi:hypothetical protein
VVEYQALLQTKVVVLMGQLLTHSQQRLVQILEVEVAGAVIVLLQLAQAAQAAPALLS